MKTKTLNPGDKVKLKTKHKAWQGHILESHDQEVILLKLVSGYNIGIRENEILDVRILEKLKPKSREDTSKKPLGVLDKDEKLPNIAIIITGGTISARLDPKTGATTWTDAEEILTLAPELNKICNIIKIEKPFMKASEDMAFLDYKKIAQTCEKLLNNKEISGVIITHGTDFLHYTASALSFFLRDLNKPVALTYSQRSIDRGSTDASLNLLCAAKYAISDVAEVALIGHKNLDDNICVAMTGTKVRKLHSSRRDAFKIINDTPLAEISKDKFEILKQFNARDNKRKLKLDAKFNDQVALVKIYPGQDPEILDFYVDKGYKGIILELGGLGHVPGNSATKFNWIPKITQLVKKGIIVCGTAQTIYGELNTKVYSAGRRLEKTGIILLKDMLSETAFVKLAWILGHNSWIKDKSKIKEKLLENISNEFNPKLGFKDF